MNGKTTIISESQLAQQLSFCDKLSSYWHQENRTLYFQVNAKIP